jgi:hypothetical protein
MLVVAPEFGVEDLLLLTHRQVAVLLAPCSYRLQAPSEPLLQIVAAVSGSEKLNQTESLRKILSHTNSSRLELF